MSDRPDWLDRDLYPFEDRWLDIEGNRVHYVDEGEGPPLLLLHGNPTWSFLYRDIIKGLRDGFRCVAPDYPGFGLSSARGGYGFSPAEHAAVIERLVTELDLSGGGLMVQDWGGPIGLWVASRHPDRFRGLVIGNTWAWPSQDDAGKRRFSKVMGGPVGTFLIRRLNRFVNVLIKVGTKRRKPSAAVMAAYRGPFRDPRSRRPMEVLPAELLRSRELLAEVESGLPRLEGLPVLIVWGNRDPAFRRRDLRRFEASFPRHRTVILEGAGHYIQEDAPEEIASAIRAWWSEEVEGQQA